MQMPKPPSQLACVGCGTVGMPNENGSIVAARTHLDSIAGRHLHRICHRGTTYWSTSALVIVT